MADPLIDAAVKHISEDAKRNLTESTLDQFILSTVKTAADFHVTDVLQVAGTLVVHCARRIRDSGDTGDGRLGDKLQQIALQLDRIADSY